MSSLITKGLGGSATSFLLGGLGVGEAIPSTLPGSYRGIYQHPIFRILQRGLEVKRLYYRTEEICPMLVLVSTEKDRQSVPIRIAKLNSENIEAKVPVAMLATEYIELVIRVAYPETEFVEEKVPVAISQKESLLGNLNIYDEFEWAKIKPSAKFSLNKELKIKPLTNLRITKLRELEFSRK